MYKNILKSRIILCIIIFKKGDKIVYKNILKSGIIFCKKNILKSEIIFCMPAVGFDHIPIWRPLGGK